MIRVEDTMLVLLAAGQSRRFGDIGSKLEEHFLGKPLGLHVAVALEDMPFKDRIAVIDGSRLDYARHGFRVIENPDPARGMGSSVAIGVAEAQRLDAAAVVVALADMPRVTSSHIHHLFDVSEGENSVIASSDGVAPKPPALFGRGRFAELLALEGEAGARTLIAAGKHVVTTPAELIDVDTPEELADLRTFIRGGGRQSD